MHLVDDVDLVFSLRRGDVYKRQLSGRLLIVALVGRYLTNQLIRRGSILYHLSFSHCLMRDRALMRY